MVLHPAVQRGNTLLVTLLACLKVLLYCAWLLLRRGGPGETLPPSHRLSLPHPLLCLPSSRTPA